MKNSVDLVIRGGTIFDGSGGEPFVGDVAIEQEKIVAVGFFGGCGREEIDATGMMVTPGFIDVHTHYDGQLIWSNHLSPSSAHGVTTVVTGNCGVGFAPCRAKDHLRLIKLLEGVEDMPEVVLTDGLSWDWESFPDFVAALKRRQHDIDFVVQLPHAAVRVYVMGERAHEPATSNDLAEMRSLAREAIEAGAFGLGTSRNIFHQSLDGTVIPTAHAPEAELSALAEGMAEAGGGVIQAVFNVEHPGPDLDMFRKVASRTNSPLSFTLVQSAYDKDNWKSLMTTVRKANEEGGPPVTGQVFARPIGILLGLDASYSPFFMHPGYRRIAHLPLAERVLEMHKPEVRESILAHPPETSDPSTSMTMSAFTRRFETIYQLGSPPNYEPSPSDSIAAQAAARGLTPDELVYDMLLEEGGHALLLQTAVNYENKSLDDVHAMLSDPYTVPALGDGGAHYGMICDSTYPTFMLTYWGRDRKTKRIALPAIVQMMTSKPATMLGINDRGRISLGFKADLNVIDFDRLKLHAPRMVDDLPSNGRRLIQDADGYVATIVSGEIIMRNGHPTGNLPGRMVERSSRAHLPPHAS